MPVYSSRPSAPDPTPGPPRAAAGSPNRGRIPAQRGASTVGRAGTTGGPPNPGAGKAGPGKTGKNSKSSKTGKKSRRKDPLWARLVLILGAVLMMASGGVIAGSKALIGQATKNINQKSLLGDAGKSDAEGGSNLDGPIDLLLLGVDYRNGWEKNDTRADSIIILHIPATHDQAYLLSIPRDTLVQIPADKKSGYGGGQAKINSAFYFGAQHKQGYAGGAQLMAKTIKNLTGISFDGAAIINFGGFKKIVNALGTLHMCIDQETDSIHYMVVDGKPMYIKDAKASGKPYKPVVYKKGCRDMKGWQALDYARQRKHLPHGDYDRQRHQQQLLKAMAKKAMSDGLRDPLKLGKLLKAAGDALVLDTGGVPIADFIITLRGVAANDLVLLRTNGGNFHSSLIGGQSVEELDDTSMAMFQAVKDDNLGNFILYNPEMVVPTSAKK